MTFVQNLIRYLTKWYPVFFAVIFGCILVYSIVTVGIPFLMPRWQHAVLKHLVYPLLIKRRSWRSFLRLHGVTRLHGGLMGSYFVINGFCMGLGIRSTSDLISRWGLMASINLIPLFFGGRTNILANFLGISLHAYYLAHHWIGRVVILQGLLHVVLVIASRTPWTFDTFQVSGISVSSPPNTKFWANISLQSASALALLSLLSMWFVRRIMYELFLKLHLLLSMIVVVTLLIHLQVMGSKRSIFPIVALSLWGFNTCLRVARIAYRNLGGVRDQTGQATINHFFYDNPKKTVSAMRLTVEPRRPLKIRPGQYVYLFLSDMGSRRRFEAHPYVITWWDNSLSAMELSFLIQPEKGLSDALVSRNSVRRVIIDGPYGKDLQLENYETVILTAKGIGIAGILPYIRHMTYRRLSKHKDHETYRRELITRKIDIYWVLEDNCQQDWISEWMVQLRDKDFEKQSKPPPITNGNLDDEPSDNPDDNSNADHWRFIYQRKPVPIIKDLMIKRIQRSAGKTKAVVCGNPGFSTEIRDMVLNSMNEYDLLEFAEVEFRPDGVRQGFPGIRSPDQEGLEMDRISPSMQVARIKDIERLTKPSKSRLSTSYKTRSDENNELARIEFSSVELERGLTYTESKGKKVEEKEFV